MPECGSGFGKCTLCCSYNMLLVGSFTKDLSASCSGTSLPAVLCSSVMSRWEGVCVVAGKLTVCL